MELEKLWNMRKSNIYKPLENTEGWKRCPVCGLYPHIWEFDNGWYAQCLCNLLEIAEIVRAEGPYQYHLRNKDKPDYEGMIGYDNYVREVWNKHVERRGVSEY